jgi:hypothetical protein
MHTLRLYALTLFFSLALGSPSPALAYNSKVKRLAKKTGLSLEILKAAKAERFFHRDVYQRRQFIKDLSANPKKELLPLIVYIGLTENKDEAIRRSCIRMYAHFGLLVDKKEIRSLVFPAIKKALSNSKRGQDQRWAFEELVRISRWFQMDEEITEMLLPLFQGKDFNLRALSFKAMCSVRHELIEEKIIIPACQTVYGSTKGYSLFDRFRAVDELSRRKVSLVGPQMRDAMIAGKDPKMQVKAMYVFREWKDPSTLPLAQKIDKTAVHKLRRGAFRLRVALGDKSCLESVVNMLPAGHIDLICSNIEDLGQLGGDTVEKFLLKVYGGKIYPADRVKQWKRRNTPQTIDAERKKLRVAAALGLVRMGNKRANKYLENIINATEEFDEKERSRICSRILWIEGPQVNGLIKAMVEVKNEAFASIRLKAVIAVGERKIRFALKAVSDIYWDKSNWGHLKFHAAVSMFELDAKKALSQLQWYMPKYEDNVTQTERRQFVLGQLTFRLKRWSGSGYIQALDKFERTKDKRMLPLILEMLKPTTLTVKAAPNPKGRKKKPKKTKTKTRKKGELDDGQPKGPEPIYRAKNQFVRTRAVEIAALIGGEDAAEVLAKAVDDYRSVVRQAAIRTIGDISGRFKLHIGAKLEEECKVRPMALAWLAEKGVRKLDGQ